MSLGFSPSHSFQPSYSLVIVTRFDYMSQADYKLDLYQLAWKSLLDDAKSGHQVTGERGVSGVHGTHMSWNPDESERASAEFA